MKSSEVILNTRESFMTVRHLLIKGTNYEIGKKLAEIAMERHNFCLETAAVSDPVVARARRTYFARNYPIHLERSRGVASALGADCEDDLCDTTDIPYNQEMPLPPGCSVVFYPHQTTIDGHSYLHRNFDFPTGTLPDILGIGLPDEMRTILHPMMGDPYIMEIYPEDGGYASLFLTSFELLSGVLDGINSEGLIVSVNGNETAVFDPSVLQSGKKVGLHELQGMRLLLDTCATVEEAKKALMLNKHYYAFMPCIYLIADQEGNSFVYESSGSNEYIVNGTGGPHIVTNHPLHLYPSVSDFPEKMRTLEVGTSSFERYKALADSIESKKPLYTVDFMKKVNDSVSVSKVVSWIPESERRQFAAQPGLSRTLWHCIYDINTRTLDIKFYVRDELTENSLIEQYSEYFTFALEDK